MTENNWLPTEPIFEPKDVLAKVLDIVENHPEVHNQNSWIYYEPDKYETDLDPEGASLRTMQQAVNCGTTCCVAGWIVTLAGGVWTDDVSVIMPGQPNKHIEHVATDLIYDIADSRGVNVAQLFSCSTSREKVIELLHQMVDDEARQVPGDPA